MRIAKNGGGALRKHYLRVVLGQHVRGLEMHMAIDEAGRDEKAGYIMGGFRVGEFTPRMNAGDHLADDADISLAQFQRGDINHRATGEQQIERLPALRGGDGALTHGRIDGLNHDAIFPFRFVIRP